MGSGRAQAEDFRAYTMFVLEHIQKGKLRMEMNFGEDIWPQLMEEPWRVDRAVTPRFHLMSLDVSPQAVSLDRAVGSVLGTPASAFSMLQTLLEKRHDLAVIPAWKPVWPTPKHGATSTAHHHGIDS